MTVSRANTFEGGTNSTNITVGNSGGTSGDAFSSVTGTPQYSNAQTKPGSSLGMISQMPAIRANHYVTWSFSAETSNIYLRYYCYIPVLSGTKYIFGTDNVYANVNSVGTISFTDGAGSGVGGWGNFTAGIVAAAWFRMEIRLKRFTSPSIEQTIEQRIFLRPQSVIYDASASSTITNSQTWNANGTTTFEWGVHNISGVSASYDVYYDDVAISTSGWIGPSGTPSDSLIGAVRDRPGRKARDTPLGHPAPSEAYRDRPARNAIRSPTSTIPQEGESGEPAFGTMIIL